MGLRLGMPKTGRDKAEPDTATKEAAPPSDGQRSIFLLVVLFLCAFVVAVALQIDARRRASAREAIETQTVQASLLAERMTGAMGAAWGAASGAAEYARTSDAFNANPRVVAEAAAHARGVRASAVLGADGRVLAITDPRLSQHVVAAFHSAGRNGVWVGAPDMGGLATAPAIVRRVGDHVIVSVLDVTQLLPEFRAGARVLVTAPSGALLFTTPSLEDAGARLRQALVHAATPPGAQRGGAIVTDETGHAWAVGSAAESSAAFRIYVSQETASQLALLLRAIAEFALLTAAPFAAVGVLLLLLRQNRRRIQFAEAEAVRAEEVGRLAADGARAGVFEWALASDQAQLSQQATELLRASSDTLHVMQMPALAITEDRERVEESFRKARETGVLDARFRVGHQPNLAWIELRGTLIEDSRGPAHARLFGTVVDVTDRYEAEAKASLLQKQLRAAIESYTGPFALWDSRRRLLLWNKTYGEVFGLGLDLLRPRASYAAIAAAAAPRIRRESVNPGENDSRVVELASGEWLQIVERRTPDGGLVTVGVDITALKQKEQELARNERRLSDALSRAELQEYEIKALAEEAEIERRKAEDASRAKSAFLANMSHELRTPLNAIIGFSEIMDKELLGPMASEQYHGYSHDIWESGTHLLLLINDILDMAKIEAGKFTLSPHPIAVIDMIEAAVRMNKPGADKKNLPVMVDAENLPEIEADARAVKQMVSNLLSNAVKFTDQGMVLVQGRPTSWGIVIRVADTGCGIPEEHLKELATPFKQVETELSRNHQGTGLGLALSKTLAEMHGGTLKIQSELGKGTIVSIFLPSRFGGRHDDDSEGGVDAPSDHPQGSPRGTVAA